MSNSCHLSFCRYQSNFFWTNPSLPVTRSRTERVCSTRSDEWSSSRSRAAGWCFYANTFASGISGSPPHVSLTVARPAARPSGYRDASHNATGHGWPSKRGEGCTDCTVRFQQLLSLMEFFETYFYPGKSYWPVSTLVPSLEFMQLAHTCLEAAQYLQRVTELIKTAEGWRRDFLSFPECLRRFCATLTQNRQWWCKICSWKDVFTFCSCCDIISRNKEQREVEWCVLWCRVVYLWIFHTVILHSVHFKSKHWQIKLCCSSEAKFFYYFILLED